MATPKTHKLIKRSAPSKKLAIVWFIAVLIMLGAAGILYWQSYLVKTEARHWQCEQAPPASDAIPLHPSFTVEGASASQCYVEQSQRHQSVEKLQKSAHALALAGFILGCLGSVVLTWPKVKNHKRNG